MNNNNSIDLIGVIALIIGLQNLEENRDQSASQEEIINKLDKHLEEQDKQYELILKKLEKLEKYLKM